MMEIWTVGTKTPGNNLSCMGAVKKKTQNLICNEEI